MLQSQRDWLYNTAYALDSKPRIRLRDKERSALKPIPEHTKDKLLVQERTSDLYVLVAHRELEKLAEDIRNLVSQDEDRIVRGKRCTYE